MTATAESQPWTPPRWTPDVEDVFARALDYVAAVRTEIADSIELDRAIVKEARGLLHAAWILLEGANAIRNTEPVGERQRLAKALLLQDDAFFSDEAPQEQDDPAYHDGGE